MNINSRHFPELFRNDYQIAVVTFDESGYNMQFINRAKVKDYHYKVPADLPVKEGDKLLVCVMSHTLPTYKAVTVQKVLSASEGLDAEAAFKYKWAIGNLDDMLISYKANMKRDAEVTEGLKLLTSALNRAKTQQQIKLALELLTDEERVQVNTLLKLDEKKVLS